MRGKQSAILCPPSFVRLIPAHAGKTGVRMSSQLVFWAHPRACGENRDASQVGRLTGGSSPRMRGKRSSRLGKLRRDGLIPAHAGKTISPSWARRLRRAHPRACGENIKGYASTAATTGSSPRMRGKRHRRRHRNLRLRLIPAHAGKTMGRGHPETNCEAHPRACGENSLPVSHRGDGYGSSPRMRGKRLRLGMGWIASRLIPAHAGKTSWTEPSAPARPAHPRACGENYYVDSWFASELGSSPRMRGKLFCEGTEQVCRGLIPAHAGKTLNRVTCLLLRTAHPRACGENAGRSGVLALRSVRSWKTLSFPSSLKVTHCRAFVQLPFSRIRL